MRKAVMALTLGTVLVGMLTGTGCVRHWDDDHDDRRERHERHDDDRHERHERYERRS